VEHSTLQEALGAYALNAVPPAEAAELDLHVQACAECSAELDRHLEVAALMSVTERSGPTEIWDSIAGELRRDPAPEAVITQTRRADARVIPLTPRWLRPLAIAAAFVLVSGAALVQSVRLSSVNADLADERGTISALTDEMNRAPLAVAAERAMLDPTARQVSLASESAASAVIVLMPDGTGYLAEHTLAPLPADRTYQLWALVDGKVISAGILGPDPGIVPLHIDPEGFEGFAITEEVVGGVEASENPPVAVGLAA
jgi:hypothetical protein